MTYGNKRIFSSASVIILFALAALAIAVLSEDKNKKAILAARMEVFCDLEYNSLNGELPSLPENIEISIIQPDGTVIYDSRAEAVAMENHRNRPEVSKAITRGSAYAIRRSSTSDTRYFYYAKSYGDKIVRCARPFEVDLQKFFKTDPLLIISLALLLSLSLIVTILLSRHYEKEEKAAAESQRRQLKHEMTGNISHELKTPVSCMRSYLETIINHPELDKEKKDLFIERSYLQSLRLSDMIRDISLITKLEEAPELFKIEAINIKLVFEEVCDELEDSISKAQMSVSNLLPPVCIRGNYQLIYSIFRNLVENSVKYAGKGAKAEIVCDPTSGRSFAFDYRDNGPGIAEDQLEKIFERFYRLPSDRSASSDGSGLGLSIIRNAVIFHKGEITAYNVEGGGLGFRFTLSDL